MSLEIVTYSYITPSILVQPISNPINKLSLHFHQGLLQLATIIADDDKIILVPEEDYAHAIAYSTSSDGVIMPSNYAYLKDLSEALDLTINKAPESVEDDEWGIDSSTYRVVYARYDVVCKESTEECMVRQPQDPEYEPDPPLEPDSMLLLAYTDAYSAARMAMHNIQPEILTLSITTGPHGEVDSVLLAYKGKRTIYMSVQDYESLVVVEDDTTIPPVLIGNIIPDVGVSLLDSLAKAISDVDGSKMVFIGGLMVKLEPLRKRTIGRIKPLIEKMMKPPLHMHM